MGMTIAAPTGIANSKLLLRLIMMLMPSFTLNAVADSSNTEDATFTNPAANREIRC